LEATEEWREVETRPRERVELAGPPALVDRGVEIGGE
jgi:hypothetical protein